MKIKALDELDFSVHPISSVEIWSGGEIGAMLYSLGDYRNLYRRIGEPIDNSVVILEFNRTIPGTKYINYEFWRVVYERND